MDYGLPKTLPATGGAIIAGGLGANLGAIVAIFIGTFLIATLIRLAWRRRKGIGDK